MDLPIVVDDRPVKEEEITPEMEMAGYSIYLDWAGPEWETPVELVRAIYHAMRAVAPLKQSESVHPSPHQFP